MEKVSTSAVTYSRHARLDTGRVLLIALLAMTPGTADAREHRATFLYVNESGDTVQETLTDVRYVYVDRRMLNTNPSGDVTGGAVPLPYRDKAVRRRAVLLQSGRISFNLIRFLEFTYHRSESARVEELVLRLTLTDGSQRDVPASDLRGFEGATPPYLEGKTPEDEEVLRFELPPFRREGSAAGIRLQKVFFHHGARR